MTTAGSACDWTQSGDGYATTYYNKDALPHGFVAGEWDYGHSKEVYGLQAYLNTETETRVNQPVCSAVKCIEASRT